MLSMMFLLPLKHLIECHFTY